MSVPNSCGLACPTVSVCTFLPPSVTSLCSDYRVQPRVIQTHFGVATCMQVTRGPMLNLYILKLVVTDPQTKIQVDPYLRQVGPDSATWSNGSVILFGAFSATNLCLLLSHKHIKFLFPRNQNINFASKTTAASVFLFQLVHVKAPSPSIIVKYYHSFPPVLFHLGWFFLLTRNWIFLIFSNKFHKVSFPPTSSGLIIFVQVHDRVMNLVPLYCFKHNLSP